MINFILISLMLLNGFNLFLKRKSKILLIINFIFAFLVFVGTTDNNDYQNYLLMYESNFEGGGIEYIFIWLNTICFNLGMSFNMFLGVIWIISGTIYLYIFSKYSKNYEIFFLLYFMYFMFIDIVQIRSFLGTSVLCLSLYYLISKNKIRAIVFLICSIFIHTENVFFIPLFLFLEFAKKMDAKILKKISIAIMCFCILNVMFRVTNFEFISSIGNYFSGIMGKEAKMVYFNTSTRFGALLYYLPALMTLFNYYYNRILLNKSVKIEEEKKIIFDSLLYLQYYATLFFPLIMINMNFFRIYKALFLFNVIYYALILDSFKGKTRYYYICLLLQIISIIPYNLFGLQGTDQIDIILNSNSLFNK